MLERVVRIVNAQVPADHTVVVAAAQQKLPPLQTLLCIDQKYRRCFRHRL
jgi:hypothetical protein